MAEILEGWQADLPAAWSAALASVQLGFADIDPSLVLEPWEPVFPPRRGRVFPGAPKGAHMLAAYDGIVPDGVRCVILGQDPYPEPSFATGRAFEAGNLASWHELDKMFSKSVRAYMQQICAARTAEPHYARSFGDWPAVRAQITDSASGFEAPTEIGDRWVREGVLLLNTALTLSRFQVSVDPHQSAGHLPLWRPLILRTLKILAGRGKPLVIIAFGDSAAETLDLIDLEAWPEVLILRRAHPAFADRLFAEPNPFGLANQYLEAKGLAPIAW